MTNRERVITTLQHKQPDRTPYAVDFTIKIDHKLVEYYKDIGFQPKLNNCFRWVSTENLGDPQAAAPDIKEDEWGVQWDISVDKDIGTVCNCTVNPDNLKDYKVPDPDNPARYEDYAASIARDRDYFIVANMGFSFFERAWTLAGMENILMAMIANPGFVHELLDRILDFNLRVIEHVCDHDIDGVRFGDDWGQQTGLLMGPKLWREFIKPRLKQMYQAVKSKDKYVIIHCCGKIDEILPDLIEIGVDLFNPFQPEVMDVYEVKKRYGRQLSFWGGISTQRTLPFGTVQQVKDEVRQLLDTIGRDGGYVAAPAHAIPGDAKPENVLAMFEVLNNQ